MMSVYIHTSKSAALTTKTMEHLDSLRIQINSLCSKIKHLLTFIGMYSEIVSISAARQDYQFFSGVIYNAHVYHFKLGSTKCRPTTLIPICVHGRLAHTWAANTRCDAHVLPTKTPKWNYYGYFCCDCCSATRPAAASDSLKVLIFFVE
jgi:hypothetical protein